MNWYENHTVKVFILYNLYNNCMNSFCMNSYKNHTVYKFV